MHRWIVVGTTMMPLPLLPLLLLLRFLVRLLVDSRRVGPAVLLLLTTVVHSSTLHSSSVSVAWMHVSA